MRQAKRTIEGRFHEHFFASVVPSVMRKYQMDPFFHPRSLRLLTAFLALFSRTHTPSAYVMARICVHGWHTCTITDGETDASVEMIQAQSRMAKRIHLRFCASRTGQRTQKIARGNDPLLNVWLGAFFVVNLQT
jgi:hypothetical protein